MITLRDATTTVNLPADLHWTDEFDWHPVEQTVDVTLTGHVVVQVGTRQAGRPITLEGDIDAAWIQRSDLDQIKAWADVAGAEYTLNLRGVDYPVIFRHGETPIESKIIMYKGKVPEPTDYYEFRLRLMEVSP